MHCILETTIQKNLRIAISLQKTLRQLPQMLSFLTTKLSAESQVY